MPFMISLCAALFHGDMKVSIREWITNFYSFLKSQKGGGGHNGGP